MVNCQTIGTHGTDGQCVLRNNLASPDARWLIRQRTLHVYRSLILFSIRTDGEYVFTDGEFNSPSVRMETDGSNKFTKFTVGMLAGELDNPHKFMIHSCDSKLVVWFTCDWMLAILDDDTSYSLRGT